MKRTSGNTLLGVILAICIVNLIISLLILIKPTPLVQPVGPVAAQELPNGLRTPEEKEALFVRIRDGFNEDNIDVLWNMLDSLVHIQVKKEELEEQLRTLKQYNGKITKGVYSHYESLGTTQGIAQYTVYFQVEMEKGKGYLQIHVGQQGQESYRVFGWFLNRVL